MPRPPSRLPPVDPNLAQPVHRPPDLPDTILLASLRDSAKLDLFLGGTTSLGSIKLPEGSIVLKADLLERDVSTNPVPPLRIGVLYRNGATVSHAVYALDDMPNLALERIVGAGTSIARLVAHAFIAMEEARRSWDEARKSWATWVDKVAPEETEGERERFVLGHQILLRFLATGRASPQLREYLVSKLTERVRRADQSDSH